MASLTTITARCISEIGTGSLKGKVARSTAVLGIATTVERGLRFIRNMVLARLLVPGEFGKLAIIMAASMAFEAFFEVGIKQSVIQNKRGAEEPYLNAAWWIQLVRGVVLFTVAMFISPSVSRLYGNPDLLPLMRVSFLAILFRGLVSPRAYVLEKEYRFGTAVILRQGSSILATFVTIGLALLWQNAWVLVIGFVAEFCLLCILSYIIVPFCPSLHIDRSCFSQLIQFARGMFGLPILTLIAFQTDVFVLGRIVNDEQLGMYFLALSFAQLPIMLFSRMVSPVLLPVFSLKQDDSDSLRQAGLYLTKLVAIFGLQVIAFVMISAEDILSLAYGRKYAAVAIPFSILFAQALTRVEAVVFTSIYMGLGKPHLHRRFVTLRAIIVVTLMYPAALYLGLAGAAIVVFLGNLTALLAQVLWCQRIIGPRFMEFLRSHSMGLLLVIPVVLMSRVVGYLGIDSQFSILAASGVGLALSCGIGLFSFYHLTVNLEKT